MTARAAGAARPRTPGRHGGQPERVDRAVAPLIDARYRRAVRARGHFPADKQAALKCLYLVTRYLDPTGQGRPRRVARAC